MDPLSVLLMATCVVACWPCLLPCCLALPIIPFPIIIVRTRKPPCTVDSEIKSTLSPTDLNVNSINTRAYYVTVTRNGIILKK